MMNDKGCSEVEPIFYENKGRSFYDLGVSLVRQKNIFVFCFLFFVFIAILSYLFSEKQYEFSTVMQLGVDDSSNLIESPETVKSKLDSAYIPQVLSEYRSSNKDDFRSYGINVVIPKMSNVLVLISKGGGGDDVFLMLHSKVVEKLRADHKDALSVIKRNLELMVARERSKLDSLKDGKNIGVGVKKLGFDLQKQKTLIEGFTNPKIFGAQKKGLENKLKKAELNLGVLISEEKVFNLNLNRLSESRLILEKEMIDLKGFVGESQKQYREAQIGVHSEDRALLLLMVGGELRLARQRLSELEDKIYIKILGQEEEIHKKISDNRSRQVFQREIVVQDEAELTKFLALKESKVKEMFLQLTVLDAKKKHLEAKILRDIDAQDGVYKQLQFRLESFKDTRAIVSPMRSLEPVGVSSKLIFILICFFGCVAGVTSALLYDSIVNSKLISEGG